MVVPCLAKWRRRRLCRKARCVVTSRLRFSDLESIVYNRIDQMYLEVAVAGGVDVDSAVGTYVYLKAVPEEGEAKCENADAEATGGREGLRSYETRSGLMAVMRYTLLNPGTEQLLCWGWMSELMVSAGGMEQR